MPHLTTSLLSQTRNRVLAFLRLLSDTQMLSLKDAPRDKSSIPSKIVLGSFTVIGRVPPATPDPKGELTV